MKTELPSSLKEFLGLFEKYNSNGDCYFRGQSNFDWKITPSISRNNNHRDILNFENIEAALYKKFKLMVSVNNLQCLIPRIKNSYHFSWIYLMAAQHYGLPTRLLDFTFNKYSALEFAVTEIAHLNKDGAFIIYKNPNNLFNDVNSEYLKRPFNSSLDSFFFQAPQFANGTNTQLALSERRKAIQGSKFLYCNTHQLFDCISSNQTHSDELIKIKIPKSIKLEVIDYLIKKKEFAYDQYAGRNFIDHCTAVLKQEFYEIKSQTVKRYLKLSKNAFKFR